MEQNILLFIFQSFNITSSLEKTEIILNCEELKWIYETNSKAWKFNFQNIMDLVILLNFINFNCVAYILFTIWAFVIWFCSFNIYFCFLCFYKFFSKKSYQFNTFKRIKRNINIFRNRISKWLYCKRTLFLKLFWFFFRNDNNSCLLIISSLIFLIIQKDLLKLY